MQGQTTNNPEIVGSMVKAQTSPSTPAIKPLRFAFYAPEVLLHNVLNNVSFHN
jgi:hypothetical protein